MKRRQKLDLTVKIDDSFDFRWLGVAARVWKWGELGETKFNRGFEE